MRVAFLSCPYRDERGAWYVRRNIQRAGDIAAQLWQQGFAVICPHLNTAHFDGLCDDRVWLLGYLEILRRCDLVVAETFEASRDDPRVGNITDGMKRELKLAQELDLPIYWWRREFRALKELGGVEVGTS